MNLFKKTTASVALVALVSGVFSTGVAANDLAEINAATSLASKGFINEVETVADFRLGATITRAEMAKVTAMIADVEPKTSCDNTFADITATTPNNWVCGYVEALLEEGLISGNENYNPNSNVSKAEAVKFALSAAGEEVSFSNDTWQADFVAHAVSKGYVANFTDYNTAATRGFVFVAADSSHEANNEDDILTDIIDQINGEDDKEDNTETPDETPVMSGDDELVVTLSANTPKGGNLAQSADGVDVLNFDVEAGKEDVQVSSITLLRSGFGVDSADKAVIYVDGERTSKVRTFNSDDEAVLSFSPALSVKAGETKTLTVKVATDATETGEFKISVDSVEASTDVEMNSIVSELFEVKGNVTAAKLTFKSGSVNSQVTAGEEQADIYEFDLENTNSNNEDISISSITIREEGDADQEEALENVTLVFDNEEIDVVPYVTDKYITFNFDPIVIEEGKKETLKVRADIVAEAGKKLQFVLDNELDITATSSKYASVNVVNETAGAQEVTIQAGELTIYSVDVSNDTFKQDDKDVVFGELKIVNTSGKNLELDTFEVTATTTVSGAIQVLSDVEFVINGTSQLLETSVTDVNDKVVEYKETDLAVTIPQGTTILTIRANTEDDLANNETVKLSLDADNLVINELDDDIRVTDITPNTLSWDSVEYKDSTAVVSAQPLADVKVVKGATDLVALQFEVEAGESSDITLDKLQVLAYSGTTATAATKDQVSVLNLYKDSVSESNRLDAVSASKLASGVATFDGFEVVIPSDESKTFIVTINVVDSDAVENVVLGVELVNNSLVLEDADRETPTITYSSRNSGKDITVVGSGKVALTADSNNEDNKDAKTILAGEKAVVYSADALATNEKVKVEDVLVTFDSKIKNVVKSASLKYGDTVVATATNSDITDYTSTGTIRFKNISNFVVDTVNKELKVEIETETIGYEKIGEILTSATVTKVELSDASGKDSGEDLESGDITNITASSASNTFSVVPATLVVSQVAAFDGTKTKFKVTANDGNNTATGSNNPVNVDLQELAFVVGGSYTGDFKIYVDNKSGNSATGSISGGKVTFNASAIDALYGSGVVTSSETFVLEVTGTTENKNISLTIPTDGVTYKATNVSSTDITTNMANEESLGSYTY